ncbi:MAG: exo-alpha-sialidase [Clostridia bacterium]|nr:exo-alpha-sialidase [Clostridia bacterium]
MLIETNDKGYCRYRIPGLIPLPDGKLLACCECRDGDSDWARIDIRVSEIDPASGARSERLLVHAPGQTLNNPTLIADGNAVHLLYCENYRRAFYMRGSADGRTWGDAVEITEAFGGVKRFFSVLAIGPGHGICTKAGRLIVPVWLAYNRTDPQAHHPSFIATLYSDDGGGRWQAGETIDSPALKDPSECNIAELPDGRFLLMIRNENPEHIRFASISGSGVSGWSSPFPLPALPDPICQGSLAIHKNRLLFVNCKHRTHRKNLTLSVSGDLFQTLKAVPVDSEGGYSDIAVTGDTAYILYEQGGRGLCLGRIDL